MINNLRPIGIFGNGLPEKSGLGVCPKRRVSQGDGAIHALMGANKAVNCLIRIGQAELCKQGIQVVVGRFHGFILEFKRKTAISITTEFLSYAFF
jgi:hypothetical protein